jgi:predicted MFS family arabinose efflux permease
MRVRGILGAVVSGARRQVGGPARLRVVVLFAGVYAVASADTGTVGSVAPQLEGALQISNSQVGVIAAVAALSGAIGTLGVGVLTDRVHRIGLLAGSIVLWSAAQVAGALAPSFLVLTLTRVALGAVTATSGPTIASLTGDFFPARERARMLGLILTGELVGAGIGIVVSGDLASLLSWRWGFGWLAAPGVALAAAIWKLLPEPDRAGQSRLDPGATEFAEVRRRRSPRARGRGRAGEGGAAAEPAGAGTGEESEVVLEAVRARHISPRRELVLERDPVEMGFWQAVRYVLRVPTNVSLIVSTSLAYLFFAGVQTFAVLLMRSRYGLDEGAATALLVVIGVGGLAGIVAAGDLSDRWLARGRLEARVLIGAIAYIGAALLFIPGLLSPLIFVSLPLFAVGGAGLAGPDSVLGAARLDVMHPHLWGRAEGVRTFLYMIAFGIAPLLFGVISDQLGGHGVSTAAGVRSVTSAANGAALAHTFLIMLAPVAIAGAILLRAARTYPRDVATASASAQATGDVHG